MRWATRTGALVAVGIVGAMLAACGTGSSNSVERSSSSVEHGPTALPSGAHASPSLCRTYFGSPTSIAKAFGVASLELVPQVYSRDGKIVCQYLRPGPTGDGAYNDGLRLTLAAGADMSSCCEHEADAKAGAVYAYAGSSDRYFQVPTQTEQTWLQGAAARATPPK
jgi:hypothetical protein